MVANSIYRFLLNIENEEIVLSQFLLVRGWEGADVSIQRIQHHSIFLLIRIQTEPIFQLSETQNLQHPGSRLTNSETIPHQLHTIK